MVKLTRNKVVSSVNFQRCEYASGSSKEPEPVPSASDVSDISASLHLLLLMILQLHHFRPLLPTPVSNSSYLMPVPGRQLLYCTTVLFIIADWSAKVGSQEIPGVTGKFGLGVQNKAGQRPTEFC